MLKTDIKGQAGKTTTKQKNLFMEEEVLPKNNTKLKKRYMKRNRPHGPQNKI